MPARSTFIALRNKATLGVLRRYWRWQRGMTLGAQCALIDAQERVVLIRHSYRPGWFFPGGGVECGETFEEAARREAREEAGVRIAGPLLLHGMFANFATVKRDHIALYVCRDWTSDESFRLPWEIAEVGAFTRDALPADIDAGTRVRLAEIFEGAPVSPYWGPL